MTPAKKATPAKPAPSLSDLIGEKKDDEKEVKTVDSGSSTSSSDQESTKEDSELNPSVDPVTMDDVKSALSSGGNEGPSPDEEENSDQAPGDGIIKEEDDDDERDVSDRRDNALQDVGVLSRVHKLSPPGMTRLNTYSGGEDRVDHGKLNVVVKPLTDVIVHREREIDDETGKSRLLHPDIVKPAVPSDQARVMTTSYEHVYAVPYDPDNDPNR